PARPEPQLLAVQLLLAMKKKLRQHRKPHPIALSRRERRLSRKEKRVGGMLPYSRHIDANTIATRDGAQIQVIHLAGFAFVAAVTQELHCRKNVRDTLVRGLASSRLSIGAHVIRRMVRPRLDGDFSNTFSR